MQANKSQNITINNEDADKYHVEFVRHQVPKDPTGKPKGTKTQEQKHIQVFNKKDFDNLLRVIDKQGIYVTGWHEMEVVHDPTLRPPKKEPEEKAPKPRTRSKS